MPKSSLSSVRAFLVAVALLYPAVCLGFSKPSVDWSELSDRKLTQTGKAALDLYKHAWQHSETENFVYHYRDANEAETFLVHAELYYRWVKEMLKDLDSAKIVKGKSHIFIFDDKADWKAFASTTPEKLPGAEAFTNGSELFIYREPFWLEPQRVLAHEITHLVLRRLVDGEVPLFLNEGLAEYVGTKAMAMKADGNEYNVRIFKVIPEDKFIAVEKLINLKKYPDSEEENSIFYLQSEYLTRFFILNYPKAKFYSLIKEVASGKSFKAALEDIYEMDLEEFSNKLKAYIMTR